MPAHVDLTAFAARAPASVAPLLRTTDVLPLHRRWYEQEACGVAALRSAGLARCVRHAYEQENDHFMRSLEEQRSDIQELAGLRKGHWLYYEGSSERVWGARGSWGWYQVDAKFRPDLGVIELLLGFESKHPNSIPSYKANFTLRWTRTPDGAAKPASLAAAAKDEKLKQCVAAGATPPPPG